MGIQQPVEVVFKGHDGPGDAKYDDEHAKKQRAVKVEIKQNSAQHEVLREYLPHNLARNIGQSEIATLIAIGKLAVIEAH